MSIGAKVRADIETALHADDLLLEFEEDLDSLWSRRRFLESYISAAKAVQKEVDKAIGEILDGKAARMDDFLIRVRPQRKLVCFNPNGLFEWLGDDAGHAFNPNNVRITALRAIAKRRGESIDAIVNSFVDYEQGDDRLEVLPLSKAPQYASELKPGEVR